MQLTSTASLARPGTKSLRATVPEGIVAFLNLEAGDKISWVMEIIDGERAVLVQKSSGEIVERYHLNEI